MAEATDESTYVRHHKQKIAVVSSAMRHFAAELRNDGLFVDYVALEDQDNSGSFSGELVRAVRRHCPDRIVVTEPGEWRVRRMMDSWPSMTGIPVEVLDDDRLLCSRAEFQDGAGNRNTRQCPTFVIRRHRHNSRTGPVRSNACDLTAMDRK